MVLVNTDFVTGKKIETIGMVSGSERADFINVGDSGVHSATAQMVGNARRLEAEGIVNVRYTFADHYVLVYGTAVKFL